MKKFKLFVILLLASTISFGQLVDKQTIKQKPYTKFEYKEATKLALKDAFIPILVTTSLSIILPVTVSLVSDHQPTITKVTNRSMLFGSICITSETVKFFNKRKTYLNNYCVTK